MHEELSTEEFLTRPSGVPIIDVRTPAEFATGHIPGALNVPLFTDAERVEIGTAYKREGRSRAVRIGLRCVGPRLDELAGTLLALAEPGQPRLHIHCWRGGMRSASVAWLMQSTFGCRTATLRGGYKAFRHWVLASFALPRDVRVIGGLTGSGKTAVLAELVRRGESCVDLEALARHKGSAFGHLGESSQPTQAQFENELALAWRATDPARPVWIEDESRMIGRCSLPEAFWARKREAPVHVIEVPGGARIAQLGTVYAGFPTESLVRAIAAIRPRLGGARAQAAADCVARGDFTGACRLVLEYYDRAYQAGLDLHPPERVCRHAFPALDPAAIAARLAPYPEPKASART